MSGKQNFEFKIKDTSTISILTDCLPLLDNIFQISAADKNSRYADDTMTGVTSV